MRILKILAVASLALTAMPAQALIIDNFESGNQTALTGFGGLLAGPFTATTAACVFPNCSTSIVPGDVIGNARTIEVLSGADGATNLTVGGGSLSHNQGAASGGMSKVTWDAAGAGLGGVDLTEGGTDNGIMVDVIQFDVGSMDVKLIFEDTSGDISELALAGIGAAGSYFFDYADLVDVVGSVDLTMIDSIMLTIDATASTDVELEIVGTTFFEEPDPQDMPEPSIIGLLGIAAVGLGYAARRRR